MHPVGSRPPNVYWRRRVVALVLLVLVVALLVWGIRALMGAMSGDSTATPSATATAEAPTTAATATATGTETAAGDSPAACADDAVKVSATSSAREAAVADPLDVGMTIENVGDTPCQLDAGSANLEIKITSGSDQVWSSDDCQAEGENRMTTVNPGDTLESSVPWNGVRSAQGCPTGLNDLKPGTYQVRARVGDITSGALTLTLT